MLHIGLDDTDSVKGGCTTWLATEIIKDLSEFDLIGNPRLVRLNPNVPWKTRGNGAVSLIFGKGTGSKKIIGNVSVGNLHGACSNWKAFKLVFCLGDLADSIQ